MVRAIYVWETMKTEVIMISVWEEWHTLCPVNHSTTSQSWESGSPIGTEWLRQPELEFFFLKDLNHFYPYFSCLYSIRRNGLQLALGTSALLIGFLSINKRDCERSDIIAVELLSHNSS